jgi:hypothetical protein
MGGPVLSRVSDDSHRLENLEGTTEMPGLDGVPRLYAFAPVRSGRETNLFACVGIPTSIAFAETEQILIRNL